MTDEAKTPGADAAEDGENPIIDFFAEMPGVGDHVKDAYEKEQHRVGAEDGNKTPDNEGFSEKTYRDITGRDISEHGQFDMPPPDGAGEDPWAGEDLTPTPQPVLPDREYYDKIPIKEIPQLDTYDELATQWNAVGDESVDRFEERWEREQAEEKIEDLRDIAETSKDIPVVGDALGGAAEQAAGELAAEVERPPVDLSNMNEVYKEGVTPNPDVVAKVRTHEHLDTYEELETQYKQQLWARDQELGKEYESQQLEAVEDAVGDVGDAAADFVKDHPALGDVLQGAVEQAEIEANSEMLPPDSAEQAGAVGGHTFQNLPFVGDQLEDGVDNIEDPVGDDPGMVE